MNPFMPFEVAVPGKWVLAGEHAVLRGATAVALPHPDAQLTLQFEPGVDRLSIEPASAQPMIEEILTSLALDSSRGDAVFRWPRGLLKLQSTIPLGAGLGSSAALCVALTRWLSGPMGLLEADWFEFARRLEDRFHGRSSGMDVAAALAARPILFSMRGGPVPLPVDRIPRFTFHDTGLRAKTSDCIVQVEKFRQAGPAGTEVDQQMDRAGALAAQGLRLFGAGEGKGLEELAQAMRLGQRCFEVWGLLPAPARELEAQLYRQGALAVKLTGAGGGGFLVALWG